MTYTLLLECAYSSVQLFSFAVCSNHVVVYVSLLQSRSTLMLSSGCELSRLHILYNMVYVFYAAWRHKFQVHSLTSGRSICRLFYNTFHDDGVQSSSWSDAQHGETIADSATAEASIARLSSRLCLASRMDFFLNKLWPYSHVSM